MSANLDALPERVEQIERKLDLFIDVQSRRPSSKRRVKKR